jgi:hypothetical protein
LSLVASVASSALALVSLIDCGPSRFDGLTGGTSAARLVHPMSGSYAFTDEPTLSWEMPSSVTESTLEICEDLACATVLATKRVSGTQSSILIPPREFFDSGSLEKEEYSEPFYWRVTADGRPPSLVWQINLAPSRKKDAAWGCLSDFNADGYAEVLVGLPADNAIAILPTEYVDRRTGDPNAEECLPTAPFRWLRERPDLTNFGGRLAIAGDVNGDGFVDALVAATTNALGVSHAFLLYGAPGSGFFRDGPGQELTIAGAGPELGERLAGPGDIDGDGYADILIVGPKGLYVFWGSKDGPVSPATRFGDEGLGCDVAAVGDIDGDGLADFAASIGCEGPTDPGIVYVYFGTRDRSLSRILELPRPAAGLSISNFGSVLGLAGDFDLDGRSELFVGAPDIGKAFIYRANADGTEMQLSHTFNGDGRTRFGRIHAVATEIGTVFQSMWIGSEGDVGGRSGNVSEYPIPGGDLSPEPLEEAFPELGKTDGRVVDFIEASGFPVLSVLKADGTSIAKRSACQPDGGFEGVEQFAQTRGDISFAK